MKKLLPLLFLLPCLIVAAQPLTVGSLSCEFKTNPLGISTQQPRLSWKLTAPGRNVLQTAYSIRVSSAAEFNGKTILWDSGRIASGESVQQAYTGPALESGKRYFWQVRVWDNERRASDWSPTAFWEMGMLAPEDWRAQWIETAAERERFAPPPMFRKSFSLRKKIASARAYVSAHGLYELYLNGQKVGDEVLAPGWTAYNKRQQYQVYDVTSLLKTGDNAAGAYLGDGWFRGTLGWVFQWGFYGKKLGLLCQIHVQYTNGTDEWIATDNTWKTWQDGPIRMTDIYNGEHYDARRELPGWDMPGFDDSAWPAAQIGAKPSAELIASAGVPVRKIQEIKPVRIFRTPKGELVADLGQNMVGWMRLRVQGPAGTVIRISHAEVLDKAGNFYTENLRKADCRLEYTLKGGGPETYEPRFTFMGFRYVRLEGWPGEPTPEQLTGIVVHSDMPLNGSFECSNPLLNQLQHNILWGQKGNFVDVPTDCPQRDERLGWTGDAQAFCRTAAFNMGVAAFYTKWAADIAADQRADGAIPWVIPDILNKPNSEKVGISAGWSDVATILPWTMYQVYGDKRLLETQYPSMKAWVEYQLRQSGESLIWKNGSVFGDWLFYRPAPHQASEADGHTDRDLIATAFFAYSTQLLQQAARVLDKTEDEVYYQVLGRHIREAFQREYLTATGRLVSHSQTAYVLALMFDLLPEPQRPKAVQYLVEDIRERKNHLSTGFLGTPYLCHVLSSNGQTDLAYELLLQESYPSWLYPVKLGATTIWERWDGIKPDSTFQDPGMNSFNHYAYGAIGDWMYRVVAGLEIGSPGYRHIRIQPQPTAKLDFAQASYESQYGLVASGWERQGQTLKIVTRIPINTTATIYLPKARLEDVQEGGKSLRAVLPKARQEGSGVVVEVGSGDYVFVYPEKK
ncbi:MAG: family 78 glycoside hydrolase catalytic domain [Saprospiraceae bacterium]|nr:family 78 glycoside hydrolase catalytic domain [Saprospiraceae bacterium]